MENYARLTSFAKMIIMLWLPVCITAQPTVVKDYLAIPGPISFNQKSYNLSWSSHPSENYYKQEYLQKGETPDKYKTMLMFEVLKGKVDIKAIVSGKVEELKNMKLTNPMINYEIIQNPNTGEYILDFLLTANKPNGDISIIERNVYRYKSLEGSNGLLLFSISTRGYAPNVDSFLADLKVNRKDMMTKVAQFKLPEIKVKP